MKILIGTPINEEEGYTIERWLDKVALLKYPTDLMLVDSSSESSYTKKLKRYVIKHGFNLVNNLPQNKNVKNEQIVYKAKKTCIIKHIEVGKYQPLDEKIGLSREAIRDMVLKYDYDAWFSWESDIIIPVDTLDRLVKIMEAKNYTLVHPNYWIRGNPSKPIGDFACCLINRWGLEKSGFTLEYSDQGNNWKGNDARFKKNVLKAGGSCIQIYGIIRPIYRL